MKKNCITLAAMVLALAATSKIVAANPSLFTVTASGIVTEVNDPIGRFDSSVQVGIPISIQFNFDDSTPYTELQDPSGLSVTRAFTTYGETYASDVKFGNVEFVPTGAYNAVVIKTDTVTGAPYNDDLIFISHGGSIASGVSLLGSGTSTQLTFTEPNGLFNLDMNHPSADWNLPWANNSLLASVDTPDGQNGALVLASINHIHVSGGVTVPESSTLPTWMVGIGILGAFLRLRRFKRG